MKLIDCKCTNCGGVLQVDEEHNKQYTCPFCNSLFVVQEAKNYYIQNNNYIVFVDKLKLANELNDFEIIGGELVRYTGVGVNIAIPDGVKVIRPNAFAGLRAIQIVVLPMSCTEIGARAFFNCESLRTVICPSRDTFPVDLCSIGDSAFENCKELRKVELPISLTYLGTRAFANCSRLIEVDGYYACRVSQIKASTFENCTDLTRVSISMAIRHCVSIEERAFYNCINLREANIHSKSIEPYAFYNCQSLSDIDLSSIIVSESKRIGNNAFENCYSLQEVEFERGTTIGREAFKNCKGIQTIKGKRFYVEEGAFSGCECLTELHIEELHNSFASSKSFEGTPIEALYQERRNKKLCLFCGNKTRTIINSYLKLCRKCTVCNEDIPYGQPYGSHFVLSSLAEETEQYRKNHNLCRYCGNIFQFGTPVTCITCGKQKDY